jgi:hypothetical protein
LKIRLLVLNQNFAFDEVRNMPSYDRSATYLLKYPSPFANIPGPVIMAFTVLALAKNLP